MGMFPKLQLSNSFLKLKRKEGSPLLLNMDFNFEALEIKESGVTCVCRYKLNIAKIQYLSEKIL